MSEQIEVTPFDDWGWWYKVGEIYTVRRFEHKATRGASLDCCHCADCARDRKGKELFDLYEVVDGEHAGSIIPVIACREIAGHNVEIRG